MKVTIPAIAEHGGHSRNLTTIEINDYCPTCGGPRGEVFKTHSFDGSRRLNCDGWLNPCGHIDKYSAVRLENYVPAKQPDSHSKENENGRK